MLKFELIGCAPGLAFSLLLIARVRRALCWVLTPLLLGLLRLLLGRRNHLEHDVINGGCYTNAYEIIECSSMMQLLYFNWNALRTVRAQVADRPPYHSTDPPEPSMSLDKLQSIRRTVRSPLADCPQYTYANPPETTTSLEQFLILPADCPATLGGPSAVHVFNPPETATSLDKILDYTADCPLSNSGLSALQ